MIHHPGHPHPLTSVTLDPTLSKCYACGKEHKGVFYRCSTCFYFSIHIDCATLPFKLSFKHHVHMLTLSYYFTVIPYLSKCRICVTSISEREWLYKCSKYRYYLHLDCAVSRGEPFMSIFSHGKSDFLFFLVTFHFIENLGDSPARYYGNSIYTQYM
ncbi:putative chromatin regulator PHD family [Helianthus annuus]|uniref:Chromatin regulator PHD family n=1 Tax=Helianthus annuus TaxID=4232 RepID=A0A251UKV8_HELAN|nr:putative chromatin regulator PHD family [Helianthus annuus]KAF5804273.1 putative chromatin regulator PHD family [Helianthus annuus]KAJ0568933.1 putative chromatin regulator PHD family [Helianthus annuus]KAJ0568936.1 putative chromatin regulator PHD family [Helianthus annuus]KAJ0748949.1 putative chromatin regulator PHD family [Helianthus annuus]